MEKISSNFINGLCRAWEMMYYFPIESFLSRFFLIDKKRAAGADVLKGFLFAAFLAGLLLVICSSFLSWLIGTVPGALAGAFFLTLLLIWSDRGGGCTSFSNMLSHKISGGRAGTYLAELDIRPERMGAGMASSIFAVLILLKMVVFYFILSSENFYLLILLLLMTAGTQAYILNIHTGSGATLGFGTVKDKHKFYITGAVLLLVSAKFNLPIALAFCGACVLLNYQIRERFVYQQGGKSDEAITFYGECALLTAMLIAFIYSAGSYNAG